MRDLVPEVIHEFRDNRGMEVLGAEQSEARHALLQEESFITASIADPIGRLPRIEGKRRLADPPRVVM